MGRQRFIPRIWRIESEIREAAAQEDLLQERIRRFVFPVLASRKNAPKNAGVHVARREDLEAIHRGLLFNGGVEACDGRLRVHSSLPLTIYQIGVSFVSYQGNDRTFCQRLFRRDLRESNGDPIEVTLRARRPSHGRSYRGDGALVQKTLLDYAERALLLERSDAVWRMGHGNPVTYELLTGGGNVELSEACLNVLRRLIEQHQRFVSSAANRAISIFLPSATLCRRGNLPS